MFSIRLSSFVLLTPRSSIFVSKVISFLLRLLTPFTTRRERTRSPRVGVGGFLERKLWLSKFHPIGIGFPTTISVNNCVAHFTPLPSDPESALTLKEGDVAKM
jgi:hypothetical protein